MGHLLSYFGRGGTLNFQKSNQNFARFCQESEGQKRKLEGGQEGVVYRGGGINPPRVMLQNIARVSRVKAFSTQSKRTLGFFV